MINFMGRAAGKLSSLSKGMAAIAEGNDKLHAAAVAEAEAEASPLVLPSSSEASPRDSDGSPPASADLLTRIQQACANTFFRMQYALVCRVVSCKL